MTDFRSTRYNEFAECHAGEADRFEKKALKTLFKAYDMRQEKGEATRWLSLMI